MAFISDKSHSNALLRSRIEDVISLCERRGVPIYMGFLDEAEQQVAQQVLTQYKQACYAFFGGFDEAERRILGCFPEYMAPESAEFPLTRLVFAFRKDKPLSHRDFLGTLLSIGIKRETIGDILCGDTTAVVFLREEIAPYVREQVTKIGGVGVKILEDYNGPLPIAHTYVSIQDTIASPRLDSVIKALLHCSRDKAAVAIQSGMVSLNHVVVDEVSRHLDAPCVISIRGNGRFLLDKIGPQTKKGRLYLNARKCV